MSAIDIPTLGTLILSVGLVLAGYTLAVSLAAVHGGPRLLRASRYGTLATVGAVATAVFLLAYAFQAHDFRIRYVAHYSDRSMPWYYLWASLWGGQDGSLLWWTFLSSAYIGAFTLWVRDRYRELQPWMFATFASVLIFQFILMLFETNPFATVHGPVPADGEGLNPLLQNYWMVIHPPALYLGLTGWIVPVAFVMAALLSGRLGNEWILANRRWVLLAWGFLSVGNILGMYWSYEELGWGGYWAWDPVENASLLPWFAGTAYLHSVMIQERKGLLKVWNVLLLLLTFILTIFGTFLTRSGLIASVHSFARSDIGIYYIYFLCFLSGFCLTALAWRMPDLRLGQRLGVWELVVAVAFGVLAGCGLFMSGVDFGIWAYLLALAVPPAILGFVKGVEAVRVDVAKWRRDPADVRAKRAVIESVLSREFAFLLNNWILVAMLVTVLAFTTFPLVSEALRGVTVTVGPSFYNAWMIPLGLVLLFLMGVGPLIAWRKATGSNLARAFRAPLLAGAVVGALHLVLGWAVGFPATVPPTPIWDNDTGRVLSLILSPAPLLTSAFSAFVLGTVIQEYVRGARARMRTKGEGALTALVQLVSRGRRRYGGYLVHVGVVSMYIGFLGAAYDQEAEGSLEVGETLSVAGYDFRFDDTFIRQDEHKQVIQGGVTILHAGRELERVYPAKFLYRSHPDMPTTEVAVRSTPLSDLYVIMSGVDTQTEEAQFRILVRPLVLWIWLGAVIVVLGTMIALMPTLKELLGDVRLGAPRPKRGALAAAVLLLALGMGAAVLGAASVVQAQSGGSSSLHAGTVITHSEEERRIFDRLLCQCGDCERLPLRTCGCSWAEGMRAEIRAKIARGDELAAIATDYRDRFGPQALAVPADEGLGRALWLFPIGLTFLAGVGLAVWARRASQRRRAERADGERPAEGTLDAYDDRLDRELDALDGWD